MSDSKEIVIVGGGICGLATALALHRKGLNSVVLERADSLQDIGAGIGIYTNGWRALDQLGVGSKLREKTIPIQLLQDIWLNTGAQREIPIGKEEFRCLKRSDLIQILADSLPLDTIRFGCQILKVELDPLTSFPVLQLHDGSFIRAKVVIGCDGVNSIVSDFLGLKATMLYSTSGERGFTNYPCGHGFSHEFIHMVRDRLTLGRVPVDDKLVYWFVGRPWTPADSKVSKDPKLIKQAILESIEGFPTEMVEMIRDSSLDSLILTRMRYRAPWDLLGNFRKGTVTVAGDAMHVMGPFLGQGGSAGLEDAVVLARCLALEMHKVGPEGSGQQVLQERVGAALDRYVKERRMRVLRLCTQTYLIAMLVETSSPLTKFVIGIALVVLFGKSLSHTQYDCGRL